MTHFPAPEIKLHACACFSRMLSTFFKATSELVSLSSSSSSSNAFRPGGTPLCALLLSFDFTDIEETDITYILGIILSVLLRLFYDGKYRGFPNFTCEIMLEFCPSCERCWSTLALMPVFLVLISLTLAEQHNTQLKSSSPPGFRNES